MYAGRVLRAGACAAMAVMAACSSDRQSTLAPSVPQPPAAQPSVLGMVEGQVDSTGKVTFTSLGGPSGRIGSGVSGNVYGTQGVNVLLYASPTDTTTVRGGTQWSFKVGVQNLESFPIGANQTGLAPSDTMGVFVAITSPPFATSGNCSNPAKCVNFTSPDSGFFTAPNQQFVYWHDRLGTTFGTDTTITRKPFTFRAPNKSVKGFRFTMMVGAAWPPAQQSSWNVFYNGASNSTPDDTTRGGPPWKKTNIATAGGLATETPSPSSLNLSSGGNPGPNIYLYRSDSLDASAPAVIQATLAMARNFNQQQVRPETVFGLADNAGRLAMVGISRDSVGFVSFPGLGLSTTWGSISGSARIARRANTTPATYTLHKFGTDHVTLDINGTQVLSIPYSDLPLKTALLPVPSSALFGIASASRAANVNWSSVSYTIGSTTPGNGAP